MTKKPEHEQEKQYCNKFKKDLKNRSTLKKKKTLLKKKAIVDRGRLCIWIPMEEMDTEVRSLQPLLYLGR